jgi:hypothetical protein
VFIHSCVRHGRATISVPTLGTFFVGIMMAALTHSLVMKAHMNVLKLNAIQGTEKATIYALYDTSVVVRRA